MGGEWQHGDEPSRSRSDRQETTRPAQGPVGLYTFDYRTFGAGTTVSYHRLCVPDLLAEDYLAKDNPLGWGLAARMRRGCRSTALYSGIYRIPGKRSPRVSSQDITVANRHIDIPSSWDFTRARRRQDEPYGDGFVRPRRRFHDEVVDVKLSSPQRPQQGMVSSVVRLGGPSHHGCRCSAPWPWPALPARTPQRPPMRPSPRCRGCRAPGATSC